MCHWCHVMEHESLILIHQVQVLLLQNLLAATSFYRFNPHTRKALTKPQVRTQARTKETANPALEAFLEIISTLESLRIKAWTSKFII